MTLQSCLLKIQGKIKGLTEAERKVANYVLNNYMEILNDTVTEIAEKAGSSDATVVRFCKTMGYKGFQDFKINLAQDVMVPYQHLNPNLDKEDTANEIVNKIIHSEIAVLQETLTILDYKALENAADVIVKANSLNFFGSGGSACISMDAMHKFLKIGIKSFSQSDMDIQSMRASLLCKEDVAVGISHSGCHKSVIDCLKLAQKSGAVTIGLTTQGKSPMLKYCDIVLFTSTKETAFKSESITARIAQLAIIDSLVAIVAFRSYEKSYDAIQKTRNATSNRKY